MNGAAWRSPTDLCDGLGAPVAAGDLIRTGKNRHPHYRVIAVARDKAWVRCVQHGTDHVIPLGLCRTLPDAAAEGA